MGHFKVSLTILSRIGKYNGYFYEINWPYFSYEYDLNSFMAVGPDYAAICYDNASVKYVFMVMFECMRIIIHMYYERSDTDR